MARSPPWRKGSRFSRRRYSCAWRPPRGRKHIWRWPDTWYRSGFRRTWVRLGERGRRDCLGARWGERLFSLAKDRPGIQSQTHHSEVIDGARQLLMLFVKVVKPLLDLPNNFFLHLRLALNGFLEFIPLLWCNDELIRE